VALAASANHLGGRRSNYELRTTTTVNAPVDETFSFFSRAENLGMLTPASMQFSIRGRAPAIGEGATIDYALRIGPLPITWRSRIVSWVPQARFIDVQETGPYRAWWHEHTFRASGSTTVMEDRVCYAPPLGPLGRLANQLFIVPALRRIFQYRAEVIRLRFGGN
jgi:ligand-binding SRPBCC domain-containing protein